MLPNWMWKKIWESSEARDFDFATDCQVLEFLRTMKSPISISENRYIASCTGYSEINVAESLLRLLWCRAIKYKSYYSVKNYLFILTGKPAKRTPLDGKRFRGPTPASDGRWKENRSNLRIKSIELSSYESGKEKSSDFYMWELQGKVSHTAQRVAECLASGADLIEARNELDISEIELSNAVMELRELLAA